MLKNIRQFGSKVIGAERAAAEQELVVSKRTKFGPKVLGDKVVVGTNTPAEDSKPVVSTTPEDRIPILSIPKVAKMLEDNPATVSPLTRKEMAREGGPRKGALIVLREAAEEQNLEMVVAEIDAALSAMDPKSDATEE